MSKIISINEARIDTEVFGHYNKEAQGILSALDELKKDYKELIAVVENTTGIKGTDASGYFKARWNDKQDDAVTKGNLYEALNEALGE